MTVKELKDILSKLQDDVEIKIGYGPKSYPIKFVMADIECVVLCNRVYKANPEIELLKTLAIYGKREIHRANG